MKVKVQNNFLQRNYYTQLKRDEDKYSEDSRDKPTITHQKLQQLMDRLALPAKRYHVRDPNTAQSTTENNRNTSFQQSKLSIHLDSKATEKRRQNMQRGQGSTKIPISNSSKNTKRYTPLVSSSIQQVKLKQTDSI